MSTTAEPMAKKKTDDTPPTGDHFLLRLPTSAWHLLHKLRKKNKRTLGAEAHVSIEQRARRHGIAFKPEYPEVE